MAQKSFETEQDGYRKQRVLEAALFMANKPTPLAELCTVVGGTEEGITQLISQLQEAYSTGDRALEITIVDGKASMQVKAQWLGSVAALSEKIELHRKTLKMLALIAKKGELLQSELRKYFRGDIYEYVGELSEKGYLERHKKGRSLLLKPTKKFNEEFQIAGLTGQTAKEETQDKNEAEKN